MEQFPIKSLDEPMPSTRSVDAGRAFSYGHEPERASDEEGRPSWNAPGPESTSGPPTSARSARTDGNGRISDVPALGKHRVLLVDDSLTVRMSLRAALTEAGFAVTACDSNAAARTALRVSEFSLIVLDVVLPDGSGLELLSEIRKAAAAMRVPIILISGSSDVWARIRGLRAGADECMTKPFDEATFVQRACELAGIRPAGSAVRSGPPSSDRGFEPQSTSPPSSAIVAVSERILIADEHAILRRSLGSTLVSAGLPVGYAATTERALDMLNEERFRGMVLSVDLPHLGGIQTCRQIRQNRVSKGIPILMVANAGTFIESRTLALEAGANRVIARSVSVAMMAGVVEQLVKNNAAKAAAKGIR